MTKANAETNVKYESFWVIDVKKIVGLITLKIFFLKSNMKKSYESNLFHSAYADGKKELRKKLLNCEIAKFWLFLVWCELLLEGIKGTLMQI